MNRRRKSTYAERCWNMVGVTAAVVALGLAAWLLHAAFAWVFGIR